MEPQHLLGKKLLIVGIGSHHAPTLNTHLPHTKFSGVIGGAGQLCDVCGSYVPLFNSESLPQTVHIHILVW